MRRKISFIVVAGLLMLLMSAALISVGIKKIEPEDCDPLTSPSTAQLVNSAGAIKAGDVTVSPVQMRNAALIHEVAVEGNLPARASLVAFMTALQESGLRTLGYGYPGSTSIGLFQQIADWGSYEDRKDPLKSTVMFFYGGQQGQPGLTDIDGWESMSPGEAAQAVQRSAFPDAYDKHESVATAILEALTDNSGAAVTVAVVEDCAVNDPIEAMVQAALSREGQPADAIAVSEGSFRVGTYNVRGSNHTGHESAMQRAVTQSALIKNLMLGVVGLQELRPDQRIQLMKLLPGYEIYHPNPVYGSSQLSVNSIIWDTSQFEFVSGNTTPMPFYFDSQELDIPVVELQHLETGLVITVVNTHDPSKPEFDRLRYLNAEAHAELVDRLAEQGKTVFFTGDFNSGFKVRGTGNTTYLNERQNLTWCIMTRSGVQINGYDDARGRTGCPSITTEEMGEGPVDHVYVPRDGVKTTDHTIVREGTASDHPVVYVDIAVDGAETSVDGAMSSAEFISWAANQGGFTLPDTVSGLLEFEGDAENDIEAELLPPDTQLMRGDIPLWTDGADPEPKKAGIETGTTVADNVLVSTELDAPGLKNKAIAVFGRKVAIGSYDSRDLAGVLRLTYIGQTIITGTSAEGWVFPLQKGTYSYRVNSYGPRSLNGDDFHNGTDFGTNGAEPPLVAMYGGEIVEWGYAGAWGNVLVVETGVPVPGMSGATYKYLYAHLSTYAPGIGRGSTVAAGQLVGYVGNSGNSFGEHLHLTICTTMECTSGNAAGSTDPIPFLAAVRIRP